MGYCNVKVESPKYGEIHFKEIQTIAENVKTMEATAAFGSITVNEIEAVNQRIWHSHFRIKEDTELKLTLQDEVPSLRLLFTLKDNMKFHFNEFGKGIRLKHQFNLLFNPLSDIQYSFRKGKEYAAVVIFLRYFWLQRWKNALPEFSDIIQQVELKIPVFITKPVTAQMRNIIHELMSNRKKTKILVEAKVLELLDLVVEQMDTKQTRTDFIKISPKEMSKIEEAREYLQENIVQPGTIRELSKKIGLNDFKLKRGFKQIVGCTIHQFVEQERMLMATKLLKTDKPVNKIAIQIGFKSYSHFAKVFKKYFGYSARSVRR